MAGTLRLTILALIVFVELPPEDPVVAPKVLAEAPQGGVRVGLGVNELVGVLVAAWEKAKIGKAKTNPRLSRAERCRNEVIKRFPSKDEYSNGFWKENLINSCQLSVYRSQQMPITNKKTSFSFVSSIMSLGFITL